LKFESERVGPLLSIECVLGVLVGWRLMTWSDAPVSLLDNIMQGLRNHNPNLCMNADIKAKHEILDLKFLGI
jgi:hypothetical protein